MKVEFFFCLKKCQSMKINTFENVFLSYIRKKIKDEINCMQSCTWLLRCYRAFKTESPTSLSDNAFYILWSEMRVAAIDRLSLTCTPGQVRGQICVSHFTRTHKRDLLIMVSIFLKTCNNFVKKILNLSYKFFI